MEQFENDFLLMLKCHIRNEKLPDDFTFDVHRVFLLAVKHNVLPIIYDVAKHTCCDISDFSSATMRSFGFQVKNNIQFASLYNEMKHSGVSPIIVKGPVCAACYPVPDYRISSDFDLLVNESEKAALFLFLKSKGFDVKGDTATDKTSGLHLEITSDFSEDEALVRIAKEHFPDWRENDALFGDYRVLNYTEHFAYLVYHAYSHFIAGGLGIRQLIDVALFSEKYRNEIDFNAVMNALKDCCFNFACNLFFAAKKYFDCYSFDGLPYFKNDFLVPEEFVCDILSSGLFGGGDEDRLHSANITNEKVNNRKVSVLSALFPSFSSMKKKFPVLEHLPFLLPLFWLYRFFVYAFKAIFKRDVSPNESLKIAKNRIELMKKMGIISSD